MESRSRVMWIVVAVGVRRWTGARTDAAAPLGVPGILHAGGGFRGLGARHRTVAPRLQTSTMPLRRRARRACFHGPGAATDRGAALATYVSTLLLRVML